ncbi:MAG TPA: metabolite traffic protein EboE [Vicinamibacterales bacterium]|nr:metabolite traffic protein EboE [Vicinamibacterales bacterium]
MQVAPDVPLHLTYCTNIHAADGWAAVLANVRQFAPALKERLSPSAPFGIGLRLSARDASELLQDDGVDKFRRFLDEQGLYVALINGFPHGSFHRTPVKAEVYAPDWRDDERVRYTLDLVSILERLLPWGMDGGISTAPLSYKPWLADGDTRPFIKNLVQVVAAMARSKHQTGATLHLDIEPEPDCVIETSDEFLEFFTRRIIPDGAPLLASALGCDVDDAKAGLYEHVRICLDCCHFAVEYEDPRRALDRIRDAGIQIGRVQLSSALKVVFPRDETACAGIIERLRRFADATYLHQVIERRGGTVSHFPDLDVALDRSSSPAGAEWRVHFHVPLFASEYEGLGSTQDYVREVLDLARRTRFAHHFEIETYTWDVLPPGLKIDLLDSIEREYRWVLDNFV